MGLRRKPGIVRRPVEYALIAIIVLFIGALLWSNWMIRKDNEPQQAGDLQQAKSLEGTLSEIDDLTEESVAAEEALDTRYDVGELDAASADSAADNVGGVYDETSY